MAKLRKIGLDALGAFVVELLAYGWKGSELNYMAINPLVKTFKTFNRYSKHPDEEIKSAIKNLDGMVVSFYRIKIVSDEWIKLE